MVHLMVRQRAANRLVVHDARLHKRNSGPPHNMEGMVVSCDRCASFLGRTLHTVVADQTRTLGLRQDHVEAFQVK